MRNIRVKETNHNCRPKVITAEVGFNYDETTVDHVILWNTERLGYFHNTICTWNPETQEFKNHMFNFADVGDARKILGILVDLGVIT